MNLGLPAIICWVALIGLRLSQFSKTHKSAVKFAQVLIECVWTCNQSTSATIGDVLRSCYRRDILDDPYSNGISDMEDSTIVRKYIKAVRISIYSLNILYKHTDPMLDFAEDLDTALSMPIPQAEERMRLKRHVGDLDIERRTFYNVQDLRLKDLLSIGRLKVLWTSHWDEHLELGKKGLDMTLKLYWFCPSLTRYFRTV